MRACYLHKPGERSVRNAEVVGSIPIPSTKGRLDYIKPTLLPFKFRCINITEVNPRTYKSVLAEVVFAVDRYRFGSFIPFCSFPRQQQRPLRRQQLAQKSGEPGSFAVFRSATLPVFYALFPPHGIRRILFPKLQQTFFIISNATSAFLQNLTIFPRLSVFLKWSLINSILQTEIFENTSCILSSARV